MKQQANISLIFKLLTFCGCWRPIFWSTNSKKLIYTVYSVFVNFFAFTFPLAEAASLLTVDTIDEFVEITYLCVSAFSACAKVVNVWTYQKDIARLVGLFLKETYAASNYEEMLIQARYNKQIRTNVIRYAMLVETAAAVAVLSSLLTNFRNNQLLYPAWFPYDYSSGIAFHLSTASQLIGLIYLTIAHVAIDGLFHALLWQICCQFDILEHRLRTTGTGSHSAVRKCVRHHNFIYRLATMTNNTLNMTIFAQFCGSFLVLCLSLVQLLKQDILSIEFLALMMYLITIMAQSFIYCWYGNELRLKSIGFSDMIFESDWMKLNESSKRILLIMMCRTKSPIQFHSAHVITANVNFFVVLVKSSYSAYNLLQNSR